MRHLQMQRSKNINIIISDGFPLVLHSFNEFRKWYLNHYDFTMYSQEEIGALLEEEKPDGYPCSPLLINNYNDILYLDMRYITVNADDCKSV